GPRSGDPERVALQTLKGDIEFRNLTFAFGATTILHDVSAKIAAGQTAALVGPTGSGKSALISLLARLYDPPPGSVFVDGVDVRELPLAVLRGPIGFVPQEPFLFSDSLAANVAFGFDAQDARGAALSASAKATADRRSFSEGWSGPPGDRQQSILDAAAVSRLDKDVA